MSGGIQLYSMATPNGQKIGIALEEMGLPYTPHLVNIQKGEQFKPEFIAVSPGSKIPAIVDPEGPGGQPITVFESGAILLYLADKSKMFISTDPRLRQETIEWLFFQVGNVGPMFGNFGHYYKFMAGKVSDGYSVQRFANESKRWLGVLNTRLQGRHYLVGNEYSIADMAMVPWVNALEAFYKAGTRLELDQFTNVRAWVNRVLSKPKTAKGLTVCKP